MPWELNNLCDSCAYNKRIKQIHFLFYAIVIVKQQYENVAALLNSYTLLKIAFDSIDRYSVN